MHNHSYENEFNLHVNEISFSYERMSTKTRFEKEAKDNSEMAYSRIHHIYQNALRHEQHGDVTPSSRRLVSRRFQ